MGFCSVSNTCVRAAGTRAPCGHTRTHTGTHALAASRSDGHKGRPPRPASAAAAGSRQQLRARPRSNSPAPARSAEALRRAAAGRLRAAGGSGAAAARRGGGGGGAGGKRHKVKPHCQTCPAIAAASGGGALRVRLSGGDRALQLPSREAGAGGRTRAGASHSRIYIFPAWAAPCRAGGSLQPARGRALCLFLCKKTSSGTPSGAPRPFAI